MFFANGQNFMVILQVDGIRYVMHEPLQLIPRPGDTFDYAGRNYQVSDVDYAFPVKHRHGKMKIYLTCA